MARDQYAYGFNVDDAGELIQLIGGADREHREGLVRRNGGGGATISFVIVSVTTASSGDYFGLKVATVTIRGAPCDRTNLIGTTATVVDHDECYLNEDNAALVGRRGKAHEQVYLSLDPEAEEGALTPCHWDVLNICCP